MRLFSRVGTALLLCGTAVAATAAGVSDHEIVLGTHIDLSGPAAPGMPMLRYGMQMRLDEANEAGGVNGRKFRLIVEDNGSQPQQAVRATQKLIRKDGVFAIVNPFGSGTNAAAVKIAIDAGVIYFAPWAAAAVLHKVAGNSPLLFTTTPDYDTTSASAVSWAAKNWGSKKVGLIYQEGPYGDLVKKGLKAGMDPHGLAIVAEAGYKAGDIDFSSHVARMKNANVDLLIVAGITREPITIMTEVKKLGWSTVKVLGMSPVRQVTVADLGKQAVEGMYAVGMNKVHYLDTETDPVVKKWADEYRKRFKIDPDGNAMSAYFFTDWFVQGVKAAGRDLDASKVVKELQRATFEDFVRFSKVSFKDNHLVPELIEIEQIKNGRWVALTNPFTGIVK